MKGILEIWSGLSIWLLVSVDFAMRMLSEFAYPHLWMQPKGQHISFLDLSRAFPRVVGPMSHIEPLVPLFCSENYGYEILLRLFDTAPNSPFIIQSSDTNRWYCHDHISIYAHTLKITTGGEPYGLSIDSIPVIAWNQQPPVANRFLHEANKHQSIRFSRDHPAMSMKPPGFRSFGPCRIE